MQETSDLVKLLNRVFHDVESSWYDTRHPEVVEHQRFRVQRLAQVLRDNIPPKDELVCFDLGTGTGFVPIHVGDVLSASIPSVQWVVRDVSMEMLRLSRVRLGERRIRLVGPVAMDAEFLPFRSGSARLVTFHSVPHHLPNPYAAFEEAMRMLHKDSLILVSHEPRYGFYSSKLALVVRIAQLANGLLLKVRRFLSGRKSGGVSYNTFWNLLMRQLREEGLDWLSQEEVQKLVDFHSPTATGSPDASRGIDLGQLLDSELDMVFLETYGHLGKLGLNSYRFNVWGLVDRFLVSLFPKQGSFITLTWLQNEYLCLVRIGGGP